MWAEPLPENPYQNVCRRLGRCCRRGSRSASELAPISCLQTDASDPWRTHSGRNGPNDLETNCKGDAPRRCALVSAPTRPLACTRGVCRMPCLSTLLGVLQQDLRERGDHPQVEQAVLWNCTKQPEERCQNVLRTVRHSGQRGTFPSSA